MATFHDALRALIARPRSTAVAILLLTLGVGANVVLFAVADAVMFRPFPFADPDRLVIGGELHAGVRSEVPYPDYIDFRTRTHSFDDLAVMAAGNWTGTVRVDEPSAIAYRAVSGNFFDVLGGRAEIGRTLSTEDDVGRAPLVIVISHAFWRREFGGDPAIIGRSLDLGRQLYTIVGVMPAAFTYPERPDAWVPIVPAAERFAGIAGEPPFLENRKVSVLLLIGRMRKGVALGTAKTDLDAVAGQMAASFGRPPDSATALSPLADDTIGPARSSLWALIAAVALLLLAAAANVAALTIVQVSARRREFAIRMALGASPSQIARGILIESSVVSGLASVGALIAAPATLSVLLAVAPDLPRIEQAAIDLRVVLYTFVVGAVVVGLCGLVPALTLRWSSVEETLRGGGRHVSAGRRQRRSRRLIVVAEMAIAMVILAGTALLARSVARLSALDLGFAPNRLLAIDVHSPTSIDPADRSAVHRFYTSVIDALRAAPSVDSVAGAAGRPLKGRTGLDSSWQREGQDVDAAKRNPWANLETITPTYFQTMGIRVIAGRGFTEDDRAASAPVVIVGETFARRTWPGQSAVGKRLRGHTFANGASARPWMTVVGVVADVRYRELPSPSLDMYVPYEQSEFPIGDIVVRTRGPAEANAAAIRARLRAIDPDGLVRLAMMTDEVDREQAPWRTGLRFFAFFAVFTTLLAVVGLYALLAATVAEEAHDLGVRMALGASAAQIAVAVLRDGGRTAAAGIAIGVAATLASARFAAAMLFGVDPSDPFSLLEVSAGLLLLAMVAALVPALRATRVDPLVALRAE